MMMGQKYQKEIPNSKKGSPRLNLDFGLWIMVQPEANRLNLSM
jgi:hypothetical protein